MTAITIIGIILAAVLIVAGILYLTKFNSKMMGFILLGVSLAVVVGVAALNNGNNSSNPDPTPIPDHLLATSSPKPTDNESSTQDPLATPVDEPTATPTESPLPTNTPSPEPTPTMTPDPSWNGSTIYLTFDDGPSYNVTPIILDTLKEYGLHATFFILDFDSRNIPLLQRMVDEGHTIGIHGYSHEYSEIYANDQAYIDSVNKLSDKVYEAVGVRPNVLRFPGGSSNTSSKKYCEGIMTRLTKYFVENGYQYFDWNVSPEDAMSKMTAEQISSAVIKDLRSSRPENVVLMHDASSQQTTGEAVRAIVEYGLKEGYHFANLTVDTPPVHHTIFN